jgi:acetylornithine deacetylase/succinyl-diaminopimelate desuccinylase-like protein
MKSPADRRTFVKASAATFAGMAASHRAIEAFGPGAEARGAVQASQPAGVDLKPVLAEIDRRHDEAVRRLQAWVRQPAIAAENRGMEEGCRVMMQLLREAGFQTVTRMPTDGHPGVFATLDAGAPKTLGVYFMYDVKQVDGEPWSSPPFEARLLNRPRVGTVIMGRGAVNQKGPEAAFLAALHAIRGAGRTLPVNLVLVAEGEEEIGSPHFAQVVRRPEVLRALGQASGIFMPAASQGLDGSVTVTLGAKGVIEVELTSSGERWGRGPRQEVHSSNKARLDSPVWHLVQALHTLVTPDGTPAIEGFADRARPISARERQMVAAAAKRMDEAITKQQLGVTRWLRDASWQDALEMLMSQPTVNIEGLVAGYTGPGGKTVLPHKGAAKLDLRLVPDMTAEGALASLKAHLAKRGFADIEVTMTGGYDPTSTPEDARIIGAAMAVYRRRGIEPVMLPRNAGSWPGYVFTGEPLRLPAGHFGLGHGSGAHAPDEYFLVESSNPMVEGMRGAVRSFVEFLYETAT